MGGDPNHLLAGMNLLCDVSNEAIESPNTSLVPKMENPKTLSYMDTAYGKTHPQNSLKSTSGFLHFW